MNATRFVHIMKALLTLVDLEAETVDICVMCIKSSAVESLCRLLNIIGETVVVTAIAVAPI
nr:MAG TPA_asm: hypothetical protein [Caudoviricetes sp.]